jgi:hypothetical protein
MTWITIPIVIGKVKNYARSFRKNLLNSFDDEKTLSFLALLSLPFYHCNFHNALDVVRDAIRRKNGEQLIASKPAIRLV